MVKFSKLERSLPPPSTKLAEIKKTRFVVEAARKLRRRRQYLFSFLFSCVLSKPSVKVKRCLLSLKKNI
jgi:hypothetical protein